MIQKVQDQKNRSVARKSCRDSQDSVQELELGVSRPNEPQEGTTEDQGVEDGDEGVKEEDLPEAGEELDLGGEEGDRCYDGCYGRAEDGDADEGDGRHDPFDSYGS